MLCEAVCVVRSAPRDRSEGDREERLAPLHLLEGIFFSCFLLSSLELRDTTVFVPYIRARLRTAAHFCEVLQGENPITQL